MSEAELCELSEVDQLISIQGSEYLQPTDRFYIRPREVFHHKSLVAPLQKGLLVTILRAHDEGILCTPLRIVQAPELYAHSVLL